MMRSLFFIALFARSAAAADVSHAPASPKPDQAVAVTAKLAGIAKPVLKLQAVAPGKYVRKADPAYEKDWTDVPMQDAGNGMFRATVPAMYQKHRWLVRYRIVGTDAAGKTVRLPPMDDTCPNFAWWCDAGPAAWSGSREPGKAPPVNFSSEFLGTLHSLHLLARSEDVTRSQWDGNANRQKQQGTLVYWGIVYDHIEYSNRGQGSAYIAGKNKWGLRFNKGHDVPIRNHDGTSFPASVNSLNLNPGGSTPYLPVHRGISGLDEVLSMRAYRLAGVHSAQATWVQWRVVTSEKETDTKDQYAGDLWGLYVMLGDMEPKLLADAKLPDGITVSIQSGVKRVPNAMMPEVAQKEWEKFLNGMRSRPNEDWWRKNLDVRAYSGFHAMNRLLGNVDLRPDGNHGYYRHADGRWSPIPWDNDMMFIPRTHQPGFIEAMSCLGHPAIAIEFRNRCRDVLDLFAADNTARGGQIGQFTADLGSALTPKNFNVDWPRLDEARWNFHPRINPKGFYFQNPAEAGYWGGGFKRTLATPDFAGFQKYIVDYCTDSRPGGKYAPNDGDQRGYGWGYLAFEAKDDKIPAKPSITRPGGKLRFEADEFASPAGAKLAAIEWRVGRIGKPGLYELSDHWRKDVADGRAIDLPPEVVKESGTYRVRARWRDTTGRCGHWSAAIPIDVKE